MPPSALSFALGAAILHALWNVLLARARDAEAATAVALILSLLAFAPIAAIRWQIDWQVLPYLAASSVFELLYFVLLAAAYRRFELSVVYPLARGLAPIIVITIGTLGVAAQPSLQQIGAIVLISTGVILVRGFKRLGHLRDVGLAAMIAGCIAAYTLIDKAGLRYADPIVYLELVQTTPTIVYGLAMAKLKGVPALRAELHASTAVASLAMFGAYALALTALRLAPAAAVTAVRESSVVIVTILAAVVLRERVGWMQITGAVLVTAGIAVLAYT